MGERKIGRLLGSVFLGMLLILTVCLPVANAESSANRQTAELTTGQSNIVKRAYQMTDIQWTPLANVTGWNSELTYYAGTTYTGLPYGQPVYASYVPWSASLVDFVAAVNTADSKMYTSYSSYEAKAPYYSTDCSAFVSWAWGLSSRQTTRTIKNFATQISTSSYAEAQVGDCLCLAGSHVVLITDITYDGSGTINGIEISESTVNAATNYCCQKTRYGAGGSYTLEYLTSKYFGNGYILYRSNTRESVTYTHSCAVPLEGDICSSCGLGEFEETPVDLVVTAVEDVTLYSLPNRNADQVGIVYAENEISVIAFCEDDSGVLWYKTADGEWILAETTVAVCSHDYSYSITAPPGCTWEGIGTYRCNMCDDAYTEVLPAIGHSYEATVIAASCETAGYTEHCCAWCGDSYRDSEVPALGHTFDNGTCSNCGIYDETLLRGDLNGDGVITSGDSVLLARYLVELATLDEHQLQAADFNGDGIITSADAVQLAKILVD